MENIVLNLANTEFRTEYSLDFKKITVFTNDGPIRFNMGDYTKWVLPCGVVMTRSKLKAIIKLKLKGTR